MCHLEELRCFECSYIMQPITRMEPSLETPPLLPTAARIAGSFNSRECNLPGSQTTPPPLRLRCVCRS